MCSAVAANIIAMDFSAVPTDSLLEAEVAQRLVEASQSFK